MFLGATLVETSDAPLGVELVHSRRATKTATPYDIVALAQVVQRGDEGVHNTACSKLSVIADQIRYLQEQAQQVCHCIWTFNCFCLVGCFACAPDNFELDLSTGLSIGV